jgi:AhpD family alkylhydroperoxidase
MQARLPNPAVLLPDVLPAALAFGAVAHKTDVPAKTLELVYMRASQINGCSVCLEMHGRELRKLGTNDETLFAVAAWREAPYFTDAERAALALAEAVTRMADRPDPVPDDVWAEAARHYDEVELAALVVNIGMINLWNRVNVATRQVAGSDRQHAAAVAAAQARNAG